MTRQSPSPNERRVLDVIRAGRSSDGIGHDLDHITYACALAGFIRHRSTIRDHVRRLVRKGWLAETGYATRKHYVVAP